MNILCLRTITTQKVNDFFDCMWTKTWIVTQMKLRLCLVTVNLVPQSRLLFFQTRADWCYEHKSLTIRLRFFAAFLSAMYHLHRSYYRCRKLKQKVTFRVKILKYLSNLFYPLGHNFLNISKLKAVYINHSCLVCSHNEKCHTIPQPSSISPFNKPRRLCMCRR